MAQVRYQKQLGLHHGLFRTFCTDCVWRSPSDALQCDLRKGMENYPSFGEKFVLGLLYEVIVALDTAGTLTLSSLLTSFVHNMCKSAGFLHIRTTIPTPLVPRGGFPTLYPFPSSFPSLLSLTISVASQRKNFQLQSNSSPYR